MPEVYFHIQWPDGSITRCYSPSTVVRDYFPSGVTLTIRELMSRSSEALERASERVRARYGFRCTSASAELENILTRAQRFSPEDEITIADVE